MKNLNILVVDDSPSFVLYLKNLFEVNGYHNIYTSYNTTETLNILSNRKIDIVLLDIELSSIEEGFQLGDFINNNYKIPIIYITAKEEKEINEMLRKRITQIFGLIYKPFFFSELEKNMQALIEAFYSNVSDKVHFEKILEKTNKPSLIIKNNIIILFNQSAKKFFEDTFHIDDSKIIYTPIQNYFPEMVNQLELFEKEKIFHINNLLLNTKNLKIKFEIIKITNLIYQISFELIEKKENSENFLDLEKLSILFDKILEGIFIVNEKKEIVYVNQSFVNTLDYSSIEEVLNKNIKKVIYNSKNRLRDYVKIWREIEEKDKWENHLYLAKKNQEEILCWVSVKKIYINSHKYYLGTLLNIKNQILIEEHLFKLAHYDELTQLPNRRYFYEVLKKEILDSFRNEKKFGLIFVDLDNFKEINDNYGHTAGDYVLIFYSDFIKKTLRKSDFIARYAGDEFCILIQNIKDYYDLICIGEKLNKISKQKLLYKNQAFNLTTSMGIIIVPDDILQHLKINSLYELQKQYSDVNSIINITIELADKVMYNSKKRGGNFYTLYNEKINQQIKIKNQIVKNIQNLKLNFIFKAIKNENEKIVGYKIFPEFGETKQYDHQQIEEISIYDYEIEQMIFQKMIEFFEKNQNLSNQILEKQKRIILRIPSRILSDVKSLNIFIDLLQKNESFFILEFYESEILNIIKYNNQLLELIKNFHLPLIIIKNLNENYKILNYLNEFPIFAIGIYKKSHFRNIDQDLFFLNALINSNLKNLRILLNSKNLEVLNIYKIHQYYYYDSETKTLE